MREPVGFEGLTNWRLDCFDEAEELLRGQDKLEMEQSHGQNAGGYL